MLRRSGLLVGRASPLLRPQISPSKLLVPYSLTQRRFLLGGIFRFARTGVAAGAGIAAGGTAYINYKLAEAGASAHDRLNKAKEWIGSVWDQAAGFGGASGANGGSSGSSGSSGANGSGNSGGSGGSNPGGEVAAIAAVTALSSDTEKDGSDSMVDLTRKMIEIRQILMQVDDVDTLHLPAIVVIGSQSSGKSSVLEAIVGHEFLPKGGNMVTRRPIELTLISTPGTMNEYCEFPTLKLGKITDFKQVQRTLVEMNSDTMLEEEIVSDVPIKLNIHSPHVPDLTLIDLPGYIQVHSMDQPLTLRNRISELADKYIQGNNIILAVSAADVDLANSTALEASRRVDPHGKRTIGVITKLDLVKPDVGVSILTNKSYPLKLGYVGVITRVPPTSYVPYRGNITDVIVDNEKEFFEHTPQYQGLDFGVPTLKTKLATALEQAMSEGLRPAARAIRKELDESVYQFKVEFDDRVLTPHTYLAQSLDDFKAAFKEMSAGFTREDVKTLIKSQLDQKVLDLLAERYWNSPNESDVSIMPVSNMQSNRPDVQYWLNKLDQSSAALTKLGVGRASAKMLIEEIERKMKLLNSTTSFRHHPTAAKAVDDATQHILEEKYYSTAEQVENAMKPYKYEIDVDDREWSASREHAYSLLQEELRQCQVSYEKLRKVVGSNKLTQVMSYVEHVRKGSVIDHLNFSPIMLEKGREAVFLRDRSEIIKMRMTALQAKRCYSRNNRALCPEVFFDVVADKMTSTAVLFLNFELLSDFYYSFPRELDNRFSGLSEPEIEKFVSEDPLVKRQVELQRRKDLLQLALRKINAVTEMHLGKR